MLIFAGALKPLYDLLVVKDSKIVQVILDAILNILNVRYREIHLKFLQICTKAQNVHVY